MANSRSNPQNSLPVAPPPTSVLPVWPTLPNEERRGFSESWTLEMIDPSTQRTFWLQLEILSSTNGFSRVVDAWAVVSHRRENREVSKLAIRQSHDLSALKISGDTETAFRLTAGSCELGADFCKGSATSKGRTIRWDLKWTSARAAAHDFVPESLAKIGLLGARWAVPQSDLRISGTTTLEADGGSADAPGSIEWKHAHGSLSHRGGSREWHSWARGHCNTFSTEHGEPVDFLFEGLSASIALPGGLRGPALNSFLFVHQGREYRFNTVWDALRSRSRHSLTEWEFEVESGEVRFRGHAQSEHRDFVGLSSEDTDGSVLYLANSKLSRLKILVYRRGKLEQSVVSNGLASFEVASREKNPYVPILI